MPITPYKLDVGFNPAPTFQPDIPQPAERGGFLKFGENWNSTMEQLQAAPALFGAAFELENDVVNFVEYATKPSFPVDKSFNLEANLKEAGLWDEYRWNFVGVQSPAEFLYKARKINTEIAARKTLQAAGPDGVVAAVLAGAASPTILLPFVGPGMKGAKAIATGLAWGFVGGALQEIPLQLNQELRTLQDSTSSIAFSTVIGGVLGGAIGFLNRGLERMSDDIYITDRGTYISPSAERVLLERRIKELEKAPERSAVDEVELKKANGRIEELRAQEEMDLRAKAADDAIENSSIGKKGSVGAAALDLDPGGLKNMFGIGERLTKIAGPVTATIAQNISRVGSRMMSQLSTAGLRLERNLILNREGEIIGAIPSNQGGTVESIIGSRRGEMLGLRDTAYKNYADYWYGSGEKPGAFRETRAYTAGLYDRGKSGKLNRRQFMEEVTRAMYNGDVHNIPEVQKTAEAFRQWYDKVLDELQATGILPEDIRQVSPDLSYAHRKYDQVAIAQNRNRFMKVLQDHFTKQLEGDLSNIHSAWQKADAKDAQYLQDVELPLDQAVKLKNQFTKELKALEAAEDDDVGPLEELINALRSDLRENGVQRRALLKEKETASLARRREIDDEVGALNTQREVYRQGIIDFQSAGGAGMEARTLRRRELKARIRNLNRSRYMVEEKARKKYDQIDALEESNIEALHRVVLAGNRALKALEKEDASFEKEMKALQTEVNKAGSATQKLNDQLDELQVRLVKENERQNATPKEGTKGVPWESQPPDDEAKILGQIFKADEKLTANRARLKEAWDNLADFENVNWVERGRADARAAAQDALTESLREFNDQITKRAQRIAKLEKNAEKLDKGAWELKKAEIKERKRLRTENVRERIHNLGGDNYDEVHGTADFSERAKEIAQIATERITGDNLHLPGMDRMQDLRGAELARTLSIDSNTLANEGFLVMDAEEILHDYFQTTIPDIELTKRIGEFTNDGGRNISFKELNEEQTMVTERAEAAYREKAGDKFKPQELAKIQQGIAKEYANIRENLQAVISRLRGTWGRPQKPDGILARGVQIIKAEQALRFLGGTTPASITDVGKPVLRYGLMRTLRDAWVPMITNMAALKATAREARYAHVVVEAATADRAFQAVDLMNYARKRTKLEAGIQWATSKAGLLFLFSQWTDLMKTVSTKVFYSKVLDDLDYALNKAGNSKERQESIEFLNSLGWDDTMQRRIWDQIEAGGGENINGAWIPQTERWTDEEAVKAFRAATFHEASASIVTPGVELPKMANSNMFTQLLFNLKSFALASTSKTLMAGLQMHDARLFNGIMITLAFGALSVYLKAIAAGGVTQERMEKALAEGNAEWWIDAAVDASGLLGAISIPAQIGQDIPYIKNVSSIGNISNTLQGKPLSQTAKSSAAGLTEDAGGAVADLINTMAAVMTGVDNPSRSTLHKMRQLLPLQNFFVLRRLFNEVENQVGDHFNLSGQRQ